MDLLALAKNPQDLNVAELVAKLLAREKELEVEAGLIAEKRDEYWRHIAVLTSFSYTNADSEKVIALAPQVFKKDDRIKFTHWPGRTAKVARFWDPADAARAFPYGLRGAAKPPYRDGVVEATFVDLDPTGKAYPTEIAAGTSAQKV